MDTTQALKDLLFATASSEEKIIQSARENAQKALSQADKVTLDAERLPTISEFLESLDGYGLTITDDDLITEALSERGQAPFDLVQTFKPSELANVEALAELLALAEKQLDQSATHDGITNADALAKARKAIRNATS